MEAADQVVEMVCRHQGLVSNGQGRSTGTCAIRPMGSSVVISAGQLKEAGQPWKVGKC